MGKARFAWLLGIVLVLAGFVPVLVFSVGTLLPSAEASALLGVFPDFSWLSVVEKWLYSRKVKWAPSTGLLFAVLGLGVMYLGAFVARYQKPTLESLEARRRDARRRKSQYGPVERIEPTLN